MHDLWRITEGKALVVTDVGQHQMWEAQYYKHDHPRKLITSGGLGTMGFALPAAIGARFARPDEEIWVVVGDGGFQMTACELSTCAQEGHQAQRRHHQQRLPRHGPAVAAVLLRRPLRGDADEEPRLREARRGARPGRAARAREREEVARRRGGARAAPGTVVIDFRVEQEDSVYPMVAAGGDLGTT